MSTSLTEILTTLQNGVVAIGDLKDALNNIFPQASATSTSAGAASGIFLTVLTSTGGTYKLSLLASS